MPAEAQKFYQKALNRLYAIKGTDVEKVTKVNEDVPSEDVLNLDEVTSVDTRYYTDDKISNMIDQLELE